MNPRVESTILKITLYVFFIGSWLSAFYFAFTAKADLCGIMIALGLAALLFLYIPSLESFKLANILEAKVKQADNLIDRLREIATRLGAEIIVLHATANRWRGKTNQEIQASIDQITRVLGNLGIEKQAYKVEEDLHLATVATDLIEIYRWCQHQIWHKSANAFHKMHQGITRTPINAQDPKYLEYKAQEEKLYHLEREARQNLDFEKIRRAVSPGDLIEQNIQLFKSSPWVDENSKAALTGLGQEICRRIADLYATRRVSDELSNFLEETQADSVRQKLLEKAGYAGD